VHPVVIGVVVTLVSLEGSVRADPVRPFPWPNGAKAAVVLSYDDGMDTHLDHAVPDLDAAGCRGTFFLPGHSESLAKRLPEWRALAARGHELANHAIFHPCLRKPASGPEREWVKPEYALESYTVERIRDEIAAMNTTLLAIDGETVRTLAYNCCDTTAGGSPFRATPTGNSSPGWGRTGRRSGPTRSSSDDPRHRRAEAPGNAALKAWREPVRSTGAT
jgi:peptidoglycan/xylan/chitin deacetylase (PgdA/CDA1 family)